MGDQRMVLHKPLLQTVDMHSEPQGVFMLFNPMTDLVQAKRDAERAQEEEEERKRRLEEEKRRKKEEERRKKEDEKQRRREEEQEKKRAAVGRKAKGRQASAASDASAGGTQRQGQEGEQQEEGQEEGGVRKFSCSRAEPAGAMGCCNRQQVWQVVLLESRHQRGYLDPACPCCSAFQTHSRLCRSCGK